MTRYMRAALTANSSTAAAAPPPEAVALESDFVVILAALLCALICMVGLIAVARCAWLRRGSGGGGGSGAAAANQASANRGLKKKILQSLPKFSYKSSGGEGKFAAECAICLAEFMEGEEIRQLPQCGHCFHVSCVDTWLGSHSSCPSCRQILVVARCQKCGEFPAVVHDGAHNEEEHKRREDNNANNRGLGFLP